MSHKAGSMRIKFPPETPMSPKMQKISQAELGKIAYASSVPFDISIFKDKKSDPGNSFKRLRVPRSASRLNVFHPGRVEVVRHFEIEKRRKTPLDVFHMNWYSTHQSHATSQWLKRVEDNSVVVYFIGISMVSDEFPDHEFYASLTFRCGIWVPGYATTEIVEAGKSHAYILFAVI